MLRVRPWGALFGLLLLLGLPGCGEDSSDEAEVETALAAFVSAIREGDATAACDQIAARTLEDLELSGSCEVVMGSGFELAAEEGVAIPDYEIADVSVDGDRAEGTLVTDAPATVVPLVREGGEWKVSGTTSLDQFHPDSPLDSDSNQGEVGG